MGTFLAVFKAQDCVLKGQAFTARPNSRLVQMDSINFADGNLIVAVIE